MLLILSSGGCKQKRIMHKNTTVISTMKEKEEKKRKTPKEQLIYTGVVVREGCSEEATFVLRLLGLARVSKVKVEVRQARLWAP